VLLSGYIGASYYMFAQQRVLLDPSFPVLATTFAIMLISTVNYLREERQRRQIRGAFGQYVSPDLVDQLTKNQGKLTLGGESRELTLLFSDVRGFTAIAEEFRDDPQALTQLMNQFLTILSNAIMDHKGTIDKFMGDAVMAFWNAPLDNDDHVRQACRAALRMIADVETFNQNRLDGVVEQAEPKRRPRRKQIKTPGTPPKVHRLNVGIGINTGRCVVGNMGSATRFDYTALGDPVNVASRLESQSRYYGAPIILGQTTAFEVMDEFALLELDVIRVVGKAVPENIFALLGNEEMYRDPRYKQAAARNAGMLAAYRARNWDAVEAALPALRADFNALGVDLNDYLDMYRARVAELRTTPPDADWDGVFSSTKK
jgi:adenylate cyclase